MTPSRSSGDHFTSGAPAMIADLVFVALSVPAAFLLSLFGTLALLTVMA